MRRESSVRYAHLAHKHVSLTETEHISLRQAPRDHARAPHPQLEKDIPPITREARVRGVRSALFDDRAEPEAGVLAVVADVRPAA